MVHSDQTCNIKPHDERFSVSMFPLEKRRLPGKLIECFKIQNIFTQHISTLLEDTTRTRNNGNTLIKQTQTAPKFSPPT